MHPHVTFLYAFRRQRFDCRQILCETDRTHQLCQFTRGLYTSQTERKLGRRIRVQGAADSRHPERHVQFTPQGAIIRNTPGCQRTILTRPCRIRMRACFDSTPVIAGGECHRINSVHNAFVVGGGTIRIR